MRKTRILLAGGGTGGHVLPLVAVARAIRKVASDAKVYFIGPEEFPLDELREEGVVVKKIIAAGKIRRYFSPLYVWELVKLPLAAIESFVKVLLINPDVVLGKGSYGSVLPILCARLLGKQVILHESDVMPGLANRFLSKFINHIALAFEETRKYFPGKNIYMTGNPIRLKYLDLTKEEAREFLQPLFHSISVRSYTNAISGEGGSRKAIFVSGGSQGAQRINEIVLKTIKDLIQKYTVIWSTGQNNYQAIKNELKNHNVNTSHTIVEDLLTMSAESDGRLRLFPLLAEKELAAAYILCDIVIGRAGSGTIFEAAAFGKPAILIPIESAGNHQLYNAQSYAGTGAAKILRESELSAPALLKILNDLMANDQLLIQMSQSAGKFAKIDAAEQLAQILLTNQSRI